MGRSELNEHDRMISLVDVIAVLVRRWRLVVSIPVLVALCYVGISWTASRKKATEAPLVVVIAELVTNQSLAPFLAMSSANLPATILGTFRNPAVLRDAMKKAGLQKIAGTQFDSFRDSEAFDAFITMRLVRNESVDGAPLPNTSSVYDSDFRATDQVFSFSIAERMTIKQGTAFAGWFISLVNEVLKAQVSEAAQYYVEAVQLALKNLPRARTASATNPGDPMAQFPITLQEFAIASEYLREPVDVLKPVTPPSIRAIPNTRWEPRAQNIILAAIVGLFFSSLLAFVWEYVAHVRADAEAMATLRAAAAAARGVKRHRHPESRSRKARTG